MIAATEPGLYRHCPTVHQFGSVLKTDQILDACFSQLTLHGPTWWKFHLAQSEETRAIFHNDLKQTQRSQPQKLRKDVSLSHARKLEHTLVPPPDSGTGKGEMWHIGSH